MHLNMILLIHLLVIVAITRTSSLKIKSATCVEQYAVKFHFVIADKMRSDMLMCRCNCDEDKASMEFYGAIDNNRKECNEMITESRGFCIEAVRDNMTLPGCDNSGYSYCNVKMTANEVFNFTTFDIHSRYYNITTMDGEIIQVSVPVDQNYVLVKDKPYKIYVKGPPCEHDFLRFYQNINGILDRRYEACKTNSLGDKFLRTNQFVITNNPSYHRKLWPRMDYSDEVCKQVYSGFKFNSYNDYDSNCQQILYIPHFRDVNETAAFLSREVDLNLVSLSQDEPITNNSQSPSSTQSLDDQTQQVNLTMNILEQLPITKVQYINSIINTPLGIVVLTVLILIFIMLFIVNYCNFYKI